MKNSSEKPKYDKLFKVADFIGAANSGTIPFTTTSGFKVVERGPKKVWKKPTLGVKPVATATNVAKKFEKKRETSIKLLPHWKKVSEIECKKMEALEFVVEEVEEIGTFGSCAYYDKQMDKLTTKQEKLLQDGPLVFPPTAKEDEILMDLMNGNDERIVVATESVLSMLMTCTKSIYPWDIMVTKKGNSIRLDKRNGGVVDYISVNENASETPLEGDGMNCRQALSVEATKLQKEVRDVIKSSDEIVFQPMPEGFSEGVIKYRKLWMDTFSLVVRGSCHFALQGKGGTLEDVEYSTIPESETSLVNCYALNEYEKVGIEYRRGLDHQRGAILASELKNNWVKIARYMLLIRWVTECELVGVETMKLAFVSRSGFKDRKKHVLLGIVTERTDTIMQKMGMEMSNGYGILKALVDLWFGVTVVKNGDELQVVEEGGLEDGNYCVVKDPYKSVLYVYRVDESE